MATTPAEQQFFWQLRWSLRDVLALVVVSIVLGLIFYLWDGAYQLLNRLIGDVAAGLLHGPWYWGGLLLAYAIRKPGAALLGEFGAALMEFGLGPPFGPLVLVMGFVQGLALEVVFAWARYSHWGLITMVVAGVMAGLADFAVTLVAPRLPIDMPSGGVIIAMLCTVLVSGAVLGGLVSKILGDRLLAIPAARNFLGTHLPQGG
jgi:energy-coupling factor transport system substrate-specific component